ncbi:MAPEG family protein [Hyphomicrobium sp. B1]|uniref:MAPEG family protein n=1 Tax=Hyphomicrobium sp. B1 TaxID=3075651 RepID=UPI003C2CA858
MPVAFTALYSGILALIIVAMGINVTVHRFRYGVMLGDGGQNVLKRMVRIHGNTVENIPLCALLMALYELNGGDKIVLHAAGIALIAARILFAGPLWFHDGPSPIRASGVTLTWATTALLAMLNILQLRS